MRQPVRLVTTQFAIVLMSVMHLPVAADHALPTARMEKFRPERVRQPMRSQLVESPVNLAGDPDVDRLTRFSFFPKTPVAEREGGAEDPLLTHDGPEVADDGNAAPSAVGPDWRGLGRDTVFFLGYQGVVAGLLYLLPEDVTKWTAEQRKTSMHRWWENVQHPTWDEDNWYVNYLGHPYFGAIAYIRARERRFGAFGGLWYAALLSGLYEFGIEALFERPSYQDLIVTPVAGTLLGALLFEPIRGHIQGKPERQWYDHLILALTDPLGTADSMLESLLGIQTEVRVYVPGLAPAPPAPFSDSTAGSLNRPQKQDYRFYGIGIAFVF